MKIRDLAKGQKFTAEGLEFIFSHLDGMYSYCTLAADQKHVAHFRHDMPVKVING